MMESRYQAATSRKWSWDVDAIMDTPIISLQGNPVPYAKFYGEHG